MNNNKKTKAKKVSKRPVKTSRAKKKSIKNISQTHGKLEEADKYRPTTLDQVWGDTGHWKYDTMDANDYEKTIREMAKVDLQSHASRVGVIPVDNREILATRLVREFKKHVTLYRHPQDKSPSNINSTTDITNSARKVLEEGR